MAGTLHAVEVDGVQASSYILIDARTGTILASRDADSHRAPASLTKLMTAYVVFQHLASGRGRLDDQVVVSERAWSMGGSRTFLELGVPVSVDTLLNGLIVQSGNDAAVALAEYVAGSVEAFAVLMNETAAGLGMTQSHFLNPNGLPAAGHQTTAADLARLASAIIRDYPQHYAYFNRESFTHNGITQRNRNRLMRQDGEVDGLKTGFTNSAGYCVVNSSLRNGFRLISVVLGAPTPGSRFTASRMLLDYGYANYRQIEPLTAESELARLRVWGGEIPWLSLGVIRPRPLLVSAVEAPAVHVIARPTSEFELQMPVQIGDVFGEVEVRSGDRVIERYPLQALSTVAPSGFMSRAGDAAVRVFRDWGWMADPQAPAMTNTRAASVSLP